MSLSDALVRALTKPTESKPAGKTPPHTERGFTGTVHVDANTAHQIHQDLARSVAAGRSAASDAKRAKQALAEAKKRRTS